MSRQAIVTRESLAQMLAQASPAKQIAIVGRAMVALFNRQTEDEQSINDTREHNRIGFSGADAKSGSLTAKAYLKHGTLQDWQVQRWLKISRGWPRLCKYAKQLNEIAVQRTSQRKPH